MATYGDILAAFPELLNEYQIFSMEPIAGGGYRNRTKVAKKTGTFVRGAKSQAAISGEARVLNEAGVFYCYQESKDDLTLQGLFFEDRKQIFLIADDQIFASEAGFAAYGCQLVQGSTDRQVENLNVENRIIGDYPI
jgi:hypothetical protein